MKPLLYLAIVFYGGFCSMGLEMTAARVLAPYFGTSNYIWTNVIGVILLALSVGYYLGGRLADRRPRLRVLGAWIAAGGLLAIPVPFVIRPLASWLLPPGLTLDNAFLLIFKGSLVGAILFAPSVTILGMVSPFVIRLLAEKTGRVGEASGKVFAVSTVGSLLGIFLSTLLLVPAIGSRATVLVLASMLVVAGVGILFWPSPRSAVALLVVLPFLALRGVPLKGGPEQLGEWESAYQYVRVYESDGTRYLALNEGLDSFHSVLVEGSYLTGGRYYDYYNAFPFLFLEGSDLRVAILGGGGGTSARQLHHFFGDRFDLHVDAVEIDPLVTEVGRRYFDYPTEGVEVFDLDARVFVNLAPFTYDLVILDAYANQVYIPFQVATKEFFESIRERLKERAVVAMNVGAFEPDTPLVEALVRTVSEVFPSTWAMVLPQSRNLMLFALVGLDSVDGLVGAGAGGPLARIATSVGLGSRRASELFEPGKGRLLTDAHGPVEWLTDRMVLRRAREAMR